MTSRPWTEQEIGLLAALYPDTPTQDIASKLNRSLRAVYQQAQCLGLKKTPEYLAEHAGRMRRGHDLGAQSRFKPGNVPWNKGMKGIDIGGKDTRFKPGRPPHEAHNYRAIGSVRLSKDGYLERKATDDTNLRPARRWVAVHRLVWEAAHGPVPPGHVVVFKPGMRTAVEAEITLDRLECIDRRRLMERNTVHRLPKPLAQLVHLRGALNRLIHERSKS